MVNQHETTFSILDLYFFQVMFFGLYHGKSPFLTKPPFRENMFGTFCKQRWRYVLRVGGFQGETQLRIDMVV